MEFYLSFQELAKPLLNQDQSITILSHWEGNKQDVKAFAYTFEHFNFKNIMYFFNLFKKRYNFFYISFWLSLPYLVETYAILFVWADQGQLVEQIWNAAT